MTAKKNYMRWLAILFFLMGAIGIGFIANIISSPWGAGLSGLTFFILGVVFSERKWLMGWVMDLFRAAHILRQQEGNLKEFVHPAITGVDLYPDKLSTNISYIFIYLCWDNRSFQKVHIENISGEISISGHHPPDTFHSIKTVDLEPFYKQDDSSRIRIAVLITGEGLKQIEGIRTQGKGTAIIIADLTAYINGIYATYSKISYTAWYIG